MTTTKTKVLVCPYCGDAQAAGERCRVCGGLFEPLSRQASHNAMGPWFLRDERRPFQPGASYETIVKLVERGQINKYSILRGPTTKQFWTVARRVPGISHLLGYCHNCDASVSSEDHGCSSCGVPFGAYLDRNYLGLPEVKPLPWEAPVIDDGRRPAASPTPSPSSVPAEVIHFRRAAEPLGLSSFASDDELRGMASRPAPTFSGSPSIPPDEGQVEHDHENGASATFNPPMSGRANAVSNPVANAIGAMTSPESRGATLDSVNNVAARALQRRLQNQQQTIRLLMLAVGAVTLLAIAAIVTIIVRSSRASGEGANANGSGGSPEKTAAPAATGSGSKSGGNSSPPANATTVPAQPLDTNTHATTIPADGLAAPAADAAESIITDHEKAVGLMIDAKKEDRPLKDRILDAESAAALLKSIKQRASATDKPKTIDAEIIEADRLVEKLKLQEFFP